MYNRGLTLIEISVAGGLVALGIAIATLSFNRLSLVGSALDHRTAVGTNLVTTLRIVQKMGRASQLCRKSLVGGLDALDCYIDFSRPSDGSLEWIRFLVVNNNLEYQKDTVNDGNFTSIKTQLRYDGISKLDVCDDADMAIGVCPITPAAISTFHTNLVLPGKANRFFRFRLTSIPISLGRRDNFINIVQSGSFYRRNPTPFAPIVFQW